MIRILIVLNLYKSFDPRYEKPKLKNKYAIRQIPVAKELFIATETYAVNYRRKQDHSFLFYS